MPCGVRGSTKGRGGEGSLETGSAVALGGREDFREQGRVGRSELGKCEGDWWRESKASEVKERG